LTITAEILDLNIAKDLIANEVNAIQESVTSAKNQEGGQN